MSRGDKKVTCMSCGESVDKALAFRTKGGYFCEECSEETDEETYEEEQFGNAEKGVDIYDDEDGGEDLSVYYDDEDFDLYEEDY